MMEWTNFNKTCIPCLLVSQGYCNKVPQIGWPTTTEMDSIAVPEPRSLESRCQQGHVLFKVSRGWSFLASPRSWEPQAFLGLWQHSSNLCLHLHMAVFLLLLCVPVSSYVLSLCLSSHCLPSSHKDASHIRTHPSDLILTISAVTLFPHKVTFWGA